MSDLEISMQRYSLQADSAWNPRVLPDTDGEYVLYSDYQKLQEALNDMVFAYVNKDEIPHTFELEAIKQAASLLEKPEHIKFAQSVLEQIKR
jgi:hypothetical protein